MGVCTYQDRWDLYGKYIQNIFDQSSIRFGRAPIIIELWKCSTEYYNPATETASGGAPLWLTARPPESGAPPPQPPPTNLPSPQISPNGRRGGPGQPRGHLHVLLHWGLGGPPRDPHCVLAGRARPHLAAGVSSLRRVFCPAARGVPRFPPQRRPPFLAQSPPPPSSSRVCGGGGPFEFGFGFANTAYSLEPQRRLPE